MQRCSWSRPRTHRWDESLVQTTQNDRPGHDPAPERLAAVTLTILWHADPRRVGARATCPLPAGLSRLEPIFDDGAPLDDPFVSRTPVEFVADTGSDVRLWPGHSRRDAERPGGGRAGRGGARPGARFALLPDDQGRQRHVHPPHRRHLRPGRAAGGGRGRSALRVLVRDRPRGPPGRPHGPRLFRFRHSRTRLRRGVAGRPLGAGRRRRTPADGCGGPSAAPFPARRPKTRPSRQRDQTGSARQTSTSWRSSPGSIRP
jgi:hypothetical protein